MNRAVFFDRDGVINNNDDNYYVYRTEDFQINAGVIEALKTLQDKQFFLFIISNQSGIAKGIYSKEDTENVHWFLEKMLQESDIYISEIYYCPHHPDIENCFCRKPESLLIEKAIARFDLDPEKSWIIGDSDRDILAGERVGLNSILIKKNEDIRKYLHLII